MQRVAFLNATSTLQQNAGHACGHVETLLSSFMSHILPFEVCQLQLSCLWRTKQRQACMSLCASMVTYEKDKDTPGLPNRHPCTQLNASPQNRRIHNLKALTL